MIVMPFGNQIISQVKKQKFDYNVKFLFLLIVII